MPKWSITKHRLKLLRCWEQPHYKRFALDASQSFLTCKGVRGWFCSRHVKESGHVNTTVRVLSEVWSGPLRSGGFGGFTLHEVSLTFVEMHVVWFPQHERKKIQAHHPPLYSLTSSIAHLSASLIARISFEMQNKRACSFLFPLVNSLSLTLKLSLRNRNSYTVQYVHFTRKQRKNATVKTCYMFNCNLNLTLLVKKILI